MNATSWVVCIVVPILLAAVGVAASYHSSFRSVRRSQCRKSIMYEVVLNVGIDRSGEMIADMRKWFDRRRRRLVILGLRNDGTEAIVEADYRRDIEFNFGPGATVQSAMIVDAVPASIRPPLDCVGGRLFIKPTLLNPGEYFLVKVVVKAYAGLKEDFRLAGTQVLEFAEPKPMALRFRVLVPVLLAGYGACLALRHWLHAPYLMAAAMLATFAGITAWQILSFALGMRFAQRRRTKRWLPPKESFDGARRIG